MCIRLKALEARSRPTQLAAQSDILQEKEQCSTENIAETVSSSSNTTDLLSTILHQPDTQQEEEPLGGFRPLFLGVDFSDRGNFSDLPPTVGGKSLIFPRSEKSTPFTNTTLG